MLSDPLQLILNSYAMIQSKKEGKDQESIQSSTTPDPGYQCHNKTSQTRAKRSALSQQVTTRYQQTDEHESTTKPDRNNINNSRKKHHLGTVSKIFFWSA